MPFNITNIVKPKLIKIFNLHPKSHFLAMYSLIQKLTFALDHPVHHNFASCVDSSFEILQFLAENHET